MEKTNIRSLILEALLLVDVKGEFSHKVIDMALEKYSYLSKADRGFFSKTVHGVIEYRLQLDFIIGKYNNAKRMKPVIREILRMAVYQILYMNRVPDRAAINEAVNLVKKRRLFGLEGFVNGILRNISSEKENFKFEDLSIKYSIPGLVLDILRENTGKYFESTLEYFIKTNPVSIRVNTSRTDTENVIEELSGLGIRVEKSVLNRDMLYISNFDRMEDVPPVADGRCYITDVSSGMISKLLTTNIVKAVDVCASPGGKSFLLADKIPKDAKIFSCDISESKLDLIRGNSKKQGFLNIYPTVANALVYDERFLNADLVLADLPCSGIGIIGKKPDIKYRLEPEGISSLVGLQSKILDNVARYVKPGGELIFSTCTLNKRENEDNIFDFLNRHGEFSLIDLTKRLEKPVLERFETEELKKGYLKLIPGRDGCDGFFIAVFRRNND